MFTIIAKCLTLACLKRISKITLFLFFLFATIQLNAQDFGYKDLDNLKKAASVLFGVNKVNCYYHIAKIYNTLDLDSGLFFGKEALNISEKINYKYGIANANSVISTNYFYRGDYSNSIKHGNIALNIFRKLKNKKRERLVLNNLGMTYSFMGLFDKALDYNLMSLKIAEEINDSLGIAYSYNLNATLLSKVNLTEKALNLRLKALKIYKKLNKLSDATTLLIKISNHYNDIKKYDSSRYYLNEALNIAKSKNDIRSLAIISCIKGIYFKNERVIDSAIFYHNKSIGYYNQLKSDDVSGQYLELSLAFMLINKLDSAKYYLDKANPIIIKNKNFNDVCDLYFNYACYYEIIGDLKTTLKYYFKYIDKKDSSNTEELNDKLVNCQIDYEIEKVKAENEIHTLKNRNQRNLLIIFSVLILILAIAAYSRYLLKKKNNRLLSEKNIELENVNKIKDKFFAIVAHDLKNQLQAFQNILQVLTEDYDQISEEKRHKLIIRINSAANTLYGVLENLLTWSSSQIKGIEFDPKQINLNELANQVLAELKLSAEKKEVELINKISTDISVLADENMVRNIIRNLVNNSIKFSNENSEVSITTVKKENMVEVSIIDQGIGISDIDKEKLFRLDVDHKQIGSQKEKGTGLGLVISKTFIEKMKGNIWVKNNVERGCIFSFSLPIYTR